MECLELFTLPGELYVNICNDQKCDYMIKYARPECDDGWCDRVRRRHGLTTHTSSHLPRFITTQECKICCESRLISNRDSSQLRICLKNRCLCDTKTKARVRLAEYGESPVIAKVRRRHGPTSILKQPTPAIHRSTNTNGRKPKSQ